MSIELDGTAFSARRWLRSAAAVFGGFATVVALSVAGDSVLHGIGVFPPEGEPMPAGLYLLALAYRTVFTVAGGYVTARLAPTRPLAHAIALGAIGILAGTAGAIAMWHLGDQWYSIALVLLALPSTWLGGWLLARRELVQSAS